MQVIQFKTFLKGTAILESIYKGFTLNPSEQTAWYEFLKLGVSEEGFEPLIKEYGLSKPAPTCPADILNFGRQRVIDQAPSPYSITHDFIESTRRIYIEHLYDDLSADEMKSYILADVTSYTDPKYNQVIIVFFAEFFGVLLNAVRNSNSTEISILEAAMRRSYLNTLNKYISGTVLTPALLEFKAPSMPALEG